jgi:hypothetical protein
VRSPDQVAGFTSHRINKLDQRRDDAKFSATWQIDRLQLIGILRSAEPRVDMAASLSAMDRLQEVPTRHLNEFESAALPQLALQEDEVIDQ